MMYGRLIEIVQWFADKILFINEELSISGQWGWQQSTSGVGKTAWSRLQLPWRRCTGDNTVFYQIFSSSMPFPPSSWSVCVCVILLYIWNNSPLSCMLILQQLEFLSFREVSEQLRSANLVIGLSNRMIVIVILLTMWISQAPKVETLCEVAVQYEDDTQCLYIFVMWIFQFIFHGFIIISYIKNEERDLRDCLAPSTEANSAVSEALAVGMLRITWQLLTLLVFKVKSSRHVKLWVEAISVFWKI